MVILRAYQRCEHATDSEMWCGPEWNLYSTFEGQVQRGQVLLCQYCMKENVFQTTAIHHPKYAHVQILRYSTAWPCSGQNGATTCNNYLLVLSIVSFSIRGFPSFSTSRRPGICFSSSHHVPSLLAISSHHLSMNFQCCSILLPFNSKKIWP